MPSTIDAISHSCSRAMARTRELLWRPLDAKRWLMLAFVQFLASLPPDSLGGGVSDRDRDWSDAGSGLESAWEWLVAGGLMVLLVIVAVAAITAILLALLWVGSRAKLVFVDDVITGQAALAAPWKEYRREGNSLFLFRILLFFGACVLVAAMLLTVVSTIGLGAAMRGQWLEMGALAIFAGAVISMLALALGYTVFFLDAFVVPIMHRYRLGATAAWGRFLALFRDRPLPFLVVGLAVLVAFVVFGITVIAFGLLTCCLGFVLLIVPYLSNVLLLPFTVFYRTFTIEFLSRFDEELLSAAAGSR